jgi:hypothetical protein
MKLIPLTNGKFAKIDDVDFDKVIKYKWRVVGGNGKLYAATGHDRDGNLTLMHNFLKPHNEELEIDHKDGDGFNNQHDNFRIGTHQQNCFNRKINKNNTTGYKGVYLNTKTGNWYAHIMVNGKTIHLGTFSCPHKAALAYNKAAIKYFGEFANLNAIEDLTQTPLPFPPPQVLCQSSQETPEPENL